MVAVAEVWFIELALAPPACGILVAKTKEVEGCVRVNRISGHDLTQVGTTCSPLT